MAMGILSVLAYRGGRTLLLVISAIFGVLCLWVAVMTSDDSIRSAAYTISLAIGLFVITVLYRRHRAEQLRKLYSSPTHDAVGWNIQSKEDYDRAARRIKVAEFHRLLRETDDTQPLWRERAKEGY
jgi:hypothetical protein